ncbi:HAD family hydrolase [Streptomyces sp. NBC_01637]|uniref:HAD family hydrolase n=1 Tax=unclassified Streptomyces TaxID=2593676 RepID=UPI0038671145|nr:HAD hydrolase-like protein [Streptomyces sp. NBC_01653]WTD34318.1 HAD hydrolase-like protein [Streptomyces sp. NBC_01643]WTD89758.1 HAD hydrolase-like protein [Streptomyces sp. NBC_01637]
MTNPHPRALSALFASAKCVLFDFDGPVCDLFSGQTAKRVAEALAGELGLHGVDPASVSEPVGERDPLAVLQAVAGLYADLDLVGHLERRLAAEEVKATESAEATPDADLLIHTLRGEGCVLAVTTNNSATAVNHYLAGRSMVDCFGRHVHGRMPDPALLKPHPHCLRRALESTGSAAADALMIGGSRADREAAQTLGIPFIGYAKNHRKWEALGAEDGVTVERLGLLVEAVKDVRGQRR